VFLTKRGEEMKDFEIFLSIRHVEALLEESEGTPAEFAREKLLSLLKKIECSIDLLNSLRRFLDSRRVNYEVSDRLERDVFAKISISDECFMSTVFFYRSGKVSFSYWDDKFESRLSTSPIGIDDDVRKEIYSLMKNPVKV